MPKISHIYSRSLQSFEEMSISFKKKCSAQSVIIFKILRKLRLSKLISNYLYGPNTILLENTFKNKSTGMSIGSLTLSKKV